ncbi:uncharacterized protein [Lepeophtheirus salmonis]|uniref:uncharacterized protein isoform X2 n=1 Tax=Lepeophtheirus salmonis TaxID=72036 RepID=UPI001AE1DB81|nr:uncharacterized protein LOC121126225 [Lepeophtheirus salmonis]
MRSQQELRIVLFCALVLGTTSAYDHEDPYCLDKEDYCTADEWNCLHPQYYHVCRRSCGCKRRGQCYDLFGDCVDFTNDCFNERRRHCPRFCGLCTESCDNLIRDEYCENNRNLCNHPSILYLCARTCGRCRNDCRNKMLSNKVCNAFVQRGYCDTSSPLCWIMRDVCHASCTSGCRHHRIH